MGCTSWLLALPFPLLLLLPTAGRVGTLSALQCLCQLCLHGVSSDAAPCPCRWVLVPLLLGSACPAGPVWVSLWVTACSLPCVSSSMAQPWWDIGTCFSCLLQDVPGIPISKASPFLTCVPKMFSKSYAASFQPTMEVLALAKATSWIYSLKPYVLSSLVEDSELLL